VTVSSSTAKFGLIALALGVVLQPRAIGEEKRTIGVHPSQSFSPRRVETEMVRRPELGGRSAERRVFPFRVSADGRYLVDRFGSPFLIRGDAAWSLIANLTREEAEDYLADRQAKSFNTLLVNLLEHRFALHAPANRAGQAPFLKAGDFSTPNPAYFAFAAELIDAAAAKGFLVLLDVMYLGADGGPEGFWKELNDERNGGSACFEYGRYVGTLFGGKANVVFVIGGDFTPPSGSEGEARLRRIVQGVKAAGASQLWTGHWGSGLSTDVSALADLMDLRGAYPAGLNVVADCRRGFDAMPRKPAFLIEAGYEGEAWKPGDAASIRRYGWSALLGGCSAGVIYGHRDVWEFSTDTWNSGFGFGTASWRRALDSPGAIAMRNMGQLLSGLPWHTLIPAPPPAAKWFGRALQSWSWYALTPGGLDRTKAFVASGLVNFRTTAHVIAAVSQDGSLLIAYRPPNHWGSFTVDMTVLRGPARALWWDPTTGAAKETADGLRNVGVRSFEPPAKNAAGDADWLLLLSSN
jgi:hypothetical protein